MSDDEVIARRRARRLRLLMLELTPQLRRSCPDTPEAIVREMALCMAGRQLAAEEREGRLRESPSSGLAHLVAD